MKETQEGCLSRLINGFLERPLFQKSAPSVAKKLFRHAGLFHPKISILSVLFLKGPGRLVQLAHLLRRPAQGMGLFQQGVHPPAQLAVLFQHAVQPELGVRPDPFCLRLGLIYRILSLAVGVQLHRGHPILQLGIAGRHGLQGAHLGLKPLQLLFGHH